MTRFNVRIVLYFLTPLIGLGVGFSQTADVPRIMITLTPDPKPVPTANPSFTPEPTNTPSMAPKVILEPKSEQPSILKVTKVEDASDGSCDSDCSLREAIETARSGDYIEVPSGVYTLTTGRELIVSVKLTIAGPGAHKTIIQAAETLEKSSHRVLAVAKTGDGVLVSGVTIRHGNANRGGGILNLGTLILADSILSWNLAEWGGGISNYGSVNMRGNIVSDNHAAVGGGIYNRGIFSLKKSLIIGNTVERKGGGVYNLGIDFIITESIVQENRAKWGGGIWNFSRLTISNSDVTENMAEWGGGVANHHWGKLNFIDGYIGANIADIGGGVINWGTLTFTDSAIHGNKTSGEGGGIYNLGKLLLMDSTVSENISEKDGGGIYNEGNGNVKLARSMIHRNVSSNRGPDCFGNLLITMERKMQNIVEIRRDCRLTMQNTDPIGIVENPFQP